MGRAQSDTHSSLFTKSDNINLDETFDRKSALVHVLKFSLKVFLYYVNVKENTFSWSTNDSQTILIFLERHLVCPKVIFFCKICCTLLISMLTSLKDV